MPTARHYSADVGKIIYILWLIMLIFALANGDTKAQQQQQQPQQAGAGKKKSENNLLMFEKNLLLEIFFYLFYFLFIFSRHVTFST